MGLLPARTPRSNAGDGRTAIEMNRLLLRLEEEEKGGIGRRWEEGRACLLLSSSSSRGIRGGPGEGMGPPLVVWEEETGRGVGRIAEEGGMMEEEEGVGRGVDGFEDGLGCLSVFSNCMGKRSYLSKCLLFS
jgi:hypothetical protein